MADASVPFLWVVTTTDEEPEMLRRWVHYHLGLGVDRITICFDDPDDPALGDFDAVDAVECFAGTAAHWRAVHGRAPETLGDKIISNLHWIVGRAAALADAWVVALDVDELLCPTRSLSDLLREAPARCRAILSGVREAVPPVDPRCNALFSARIFKAPTTPGLRERIAPRVLGPLAELTGRGLYGHSSGKSFYRATRPPEKYGNHRPRELPREEIWAPPELLLLHFDAMHYARWREKWLERIEGVKAHSHKVRPRRQLQLERIQASWQEGEAALQAFYRTTYALEGNLWRFRLLGMLHHIELDPRLFGEDRPKKRISTSENSL